LSPRFADTKPPAAIAANRQQGSEAPLAALHIRNMHLPLRAKALISKDLPSEGVSGVHAADVLRVTPRRLFETTTAPAASAECNEYQ
jgi:hypothetical protein